MSVTDKFAHIAALRLAPSRAAEPLPARGLPSECDHIARLLGAQVHRNHFGEHLSVKQWYATPEMFKPNAHSLSFLLPQRTPDEDELLASAADPEKWLFLDTETTGLSGGTGTYAFLVGIAWWDAGGLQVEQFFMRGLDEEHSLLLELSERMVKRPVLVTFNGKSFDWPLLETRYRMTRAVPPFTPQAHLDFLHPARQIWKLRLGSVRLKELEQHVLAGEGRTLDWKRHGDINSSMIPQIYFDYLRHGYAEPLAGVFRHNQMDLRGLAAIAGKILNMIDSGYGTADAPHHGAHDPVDLCGLSRLLHRRGNPARARELYETALGAGLPRGVERVAQRELAKLAKSERDYARAITLWEELRRAPVKTRRKTLLSVQDDAQKALEAAMDAAEQLAMYYEHRCKEPQRAAELICAVLAELRAAQKVGGMEPAKAIKIEERLGRRLLRLQRRCAINKNTELPIVK